MTKPNFFSQFKDSKFLEPVIKRLWTKPRKTKVCKTCGSTEYKSIVILVRKQFDVIQSLAESVAEVEKAISVNRIMTKELLRQVEEKDQIIEQLQQRLEVMKHAH